MFAGCQTGLKDGFTQPKSRLLYDTEGEISRILMYASGNHSAFFKQNRHLYGPCLIDTKVVSGSFLSDSLFVANDSSVTSSKTIESWAFNKDFGKQELKAILDKYTFSSQEWAAWLEANQPFAENYSAPEFDGNVIELSSLSAFERAYFVFGLDNTSFVYEPIESKGEIEWRSVGDIGIAPRVKIGRSKKTKLKDVALTIDDTVSVNDRISMLAAQRRFYLRAATEIKAGTNVSANSDTVFGQENTMVFRSGTICYCDYRQNPNCLPTCSSDIARELRGFLQDQLHLRIESNNTRHLNTSKVSPISNRVCNGTEEWATFFRDILCVDTSSSDLLCSIPGGNMFVTKDVLLIGRDELEFLRTSEARRQSIGVTSNDSVAIANAILKAVYGEVSNKKLIWVGFDESAPMFYVPFKRASHQCIFHIDMYFSPLGKLDNSKRFYYLFSKPYEIGDAAPSFHFNKLAFDLNKIRLNLENDLRNIGLEPIGIEIPLGVQGKSGYEAYQFISFANGLVEKRAGYMNYLLPDYELAITASTDFRKKYNQLYKMAIGSIETGLKKAVGSKFQIIPVLSSTYTAESSLRCQVKVIERNAP
ncbi:MAG: hypothetical protein K9G41_09680 [Flavobacteriales bacterium]|nr:hypothetical protein [Flavobacteriales bacterium]